MSGSGAAAVPPSTMSFDDGNQDMFTLDRADADRMTQPQIIEHLVAEAASEGYRPCDLNHSGTPNVYLRGKFEWSDEDPEWRHIGDVFVMFVEEVAGDDTADLPGAA